MLISKEVELAKLELKDQFANASKGGALLAAAGVAGFFRLLSVAFPAAWGMAAVVPTGFAFSLC